MVPELLPHVGSVLLGGLGFPLCLRSGLRAQLRTPGKALPLRARGRAAGAGPGGGRAAPRAGRGRARGGGPRRAPGRSLAVGPRRLLCRVAPEDGLRAAARAACGLTGGPRCRPRTRRLPSYRPRARAMAASPGSGSANPRKFSEKIALHTQRQAEETRAFEQLMTDLTLSRVRARAGAGGGGHGRGRAPRGG